jgi:hypothetical protein
LMSKTKRRRLLQRLPLVRDLFPTRDLETVYD